MSASRFALNEKLTEAIFARAAEALVTLANSADDALPESLRLVRITARNVAKGYTNKRMRFDLPAVPLPVTFSLKGGVMTWQCDFPPVDEILELEREATASRALELQGDAVLPDYRSRIEEGVAKMNAALNFMAGLAAQDQFRRRVRVCDLGGCGRFFWRRAARSGAALKAGRQDFCEQHRGAANRAEDERKKARDRKRLSRERELIRLTRLVR